MAGVSVAKISAPTEGLVVGADPYDMSMKQASVLVNWLPEVNAIRTRKGWLEIADTAATYYQHIKTLTLADGTQHVVGFTANSVAKALDSTPSAITGTATITNGDWYSCCFKHVLIACNGVDQPIYWTGTGNVVQNAGGSWTLSGSGLTATNLIFPFTYKGRLYFLEKNTANIWYADNVDSYAGTLALTKLDVGSLLQKGGYLLFGAATSRQTGSLERELITFTSSKGELLVFAGDWPGSSTTWGIAGRYFMPTPFNRRAFFYLSSTLYFITNQGVFDVSTLMASDINQAKLYSISKAVQDVFPNFSFTDVVACEEKNALLILGTYYSLYMNVLTGAWCMITPPYQNTRTYQAQSPIPVSGTIIVYSSNTYIYVAFNRGHATKPYSLSLFDAGGDQDLYTSYYNFKCVFTNTGGVLNAPRRRKIVKQIFPHTWSRGNVVNQFNATIDIDSVFSMSAVALVDLALYPGPRNADRYIAWPDPATTQVSFDSRAYKSGAQSNLYVTGGYNTRISGLTGRVGDLVSLFGEITPKEVAYITTHAGVDYSRTLDYPLYYYGSDIYYELGSVG